MASIVITDKKIVEFYTQNPKLDIVTMNHIFIDILKKLSTNLSDSMSNTIMSQILTSVNDIKSDFKNFHVEYHTKMHDLRKDFIEDVKLVLSKNELTIQDKISRILETSNENVLNKTNILITSLIPNLNAHQLQEIDFCIKTHINSIKDDTAKLIESNRKENLVSVIEKTMSSMCQSINATINSTDSRLSTNFQQINDRLNIQKQVQETVNIELTNFLNKYKNNSSVKGSVAEIELYNMLQHIAPQDEIIKCSSETASGDIKLKRQLTSLPTILFESKDYSTSVNTEEVSKFQRDVQAQKCHGIFVSQNSPIVFKENYHIDIINGFIHVYVSNLNYDIDKLKVAISIVDHMSIRLKEINGEYASDNVNDVQISKQDVDALIDEYKSFAIKKNDVIDTLKNMTKLLIDKIDDIKLPNLKKTIGIKDTIEVGIMCDICKKYWGKNSSSLSAHKRYCNKQAKQAVSTEQT